MQLSELISRLQKMLDTVGDVQLISYTPHCNVGVQYTFTWDQYD